ncbi:hypothetical protein D3C72_1301990 [compost metagenome]
MPSDSGSTAPAAAMRSFWMITAPSWSGLLGKKIVESNSAVTSASTMVPVSMNSLRPVLRSRMISAPIFWRARYFTLVTTSSIALGGLTLFLGNSSSPRKISPWPMCASARRSSGWKTTGIATMIIVAVDCTSQVMVLRPRA